MKKSQILMAIGVLLALLVALYFFWPSRTNPTLSQPAVGGVTMPHAPSVVIAPSGDNVSKAGDDAPVDAPAWSKGQSKSGLPVLPPGTSLGKTPEAQAAFDAMQRLLANQDGDPAKLAAAVAQLEKANGSPVYHGVRLDVLRHSLEIGKKMMVLGDELRVLTESRMKAGANGNPEIEAAIKAKQAQMEALTNQMATSALVQPMLAPASSK